MELPLDNTVPVGTVFVAFGIGGFRSSMAGASVQASAVARIDPRLFATFAFKGTCGDSAFFLIRPHFFGDTALIPSRIIRRRNTAIVRPKWVALAELVTWHLRTGPTFR